MRDASYDIQGDLAVGPGDPGEILGRFTGARTSANEWAVDYSPVRDAVTLIDSMYSISSGALVNHSPVWRR